MRKERREKGREAGKGLWENLGMNGLGRKNMPYAFREIFFLLERGITLGFFERERPYCVIYQAKHDESEVKK